MEKQATTAAHQVAEYLKSPDDLSKISSIRRKLAREKASIESKLKSGAKEQLDSTRDGLNKLRETRVAVGQIREEMVNIERLCEDPKTWVEGFRKIAEVSRVHRRSIQTLAMVNQLREMYAKITLLDEMLESEKSDPLGPAPNLLKIHFHLTQLESFRNETLFQAKKASEDSRKALEKYFGKMGETLKVFDEHYLFLASNLIDLVKAGNAGVAVKIAKIAEIEGQRDEKAIAIKLVKRQNMDIGARFKSVHADARVFKHYRAKVMEAIRNSARKALDKRMTKFGGDIVKVLDKFDWYYGDLVIVEDELISRFPPDWKIHQAFVKAYHKALYDFFKDYVSTNPDAGSLLRISQFIKDHKNVMVKDLSISLDLLKPPLLDGKESELLDDYLKLIVRKMDEWTGNLMKTELEEFVKREKPPEEDADGLSGMQGAVIMFQMVNQQADLAIDSGQGSILARVVEESNRVMRQTQSTWIKTLETEFKKQVANPEETPGGLVEYIIALANEQVKSADFTEALLARLEPVVSEKYQTAIADKLNDALDGYLDVAKKCVQLLIDSVFNDLRPATKGLFTNSWYNDAVMDQIIETLKDYMADYKLHLHSSLYDLLVEDIIDTFLITYLAGLRKASKLKIPAAINRIRDDVKKSFAFFSTIKDPKELEGYFDVLDSVLGLLTASKTLILLDYQQLVKKYGDVNTLAYAESIIKARDDLDKGDAKGILESLKRKPPRPESISQTPSIFTRLPVERSGISGFLPLGT